MTYIVPVVVYINADENPLHSEKYFLDRLIRTNKTLFSKIGMSSETTENIQKIIEAETKSLSEKLIPIISNSSVVSEILPDDEMLKQAFDRIGYEDIFISNIEPYSMILITSSESFIIVSENKKTIDDLLTSLDADFKELGDITKDFGLKYLGLVRGEMYASYMLKKNFKGMNDYKMISSKNEFEQEVINFISLITDSYLPNIEIFFSFPDESFEYDVLVLLDSKTIIDVEVKDYTQLKLESHQDYDSLKNKLILSPIDKAKKLDAKILVVTKGFPSQTFEQMKEFASSRDVVLLSEHNYKEEIQNILLVHSTNIIKQNSRRRASRFRRTIS